MPSYERNKKYAEKYLAAHDRITIRVSKESGLKETIQAHAESKGESVQSFIIRAIIETMDRDTNPEILIDDPPPLNWNDK